MGMTIYYRVLICALSSTLVSPFRYFNKFRSTSSSLASINSFIISAVSNTALSVDDEFLSWAKFHNIFHDNVHIGYDNKTNVRGLYATKDLLPLDVILKVPLSLCFSGDINGMDIQSSFCIDDWEWPMKIALELLIEYHKSNNSNSHNDSHDEDSTLSCTLSPTSSKYSIYQPYFNILPTIHSIRLPYQWKINHNQYTSSSTTSSSTKSPTYNNQVMVHFINKVSPILMNSIELQQDWRDRALYTIEEINDNIANKAMSSSSLSQSNIRSTAIHIFGSNTAPPSSALIDSALFSHFLDIVQTRNCRLTRINDDVSNNNDDNSDGNSTPSSLPSSFNAVVPFLDLLNHKHPEECNAEFYLGAAASEDDGYYTSGEEEKEDDNSAIIPTNSSYNQSAVNNINYHSSSNNSNSNNSNSKHQEEYVYVTCTQAIHEGEEIFITYGALTNEEALVSYGFVPGVSKYDEVEIIVPIWNLFSLSLSTAATSVDDNNDDNNVDDDDDDDDDNNHDNTIDTSSALVLSLLTKLNLIQPSSSSSSSSSITYDINTTASLKQQQQQGYTVYRDGVSLSLLLTARILCVSDTEQQALSDEVDTLLSGGVMMNNQVDDSTEYNERNSCSDNSIYEASIYKRPMVSIENEKQAISLIKTIIQEQLQYFTSLTPPPPPPLTAVSQTECVDENMIQQEVDKIIITTADKLIIEQQVLLLRDAKIHILNDTLSWLDTYYKSL